VCYTMTVARELARGCTVIASDEFCGFVRFAERMYRRSKVDTLSLATLIQNLKSGRVVPKKRVRDYFGIAERLP
jgi:hypothetical protein